MYLLGRLLTVVVDHKPLLPLYKGSGRPKQARVDRHRMKLEAYRFEMKWEAGNKNPCDYGSRHPPEGTETGSEDDTEIYVNCMLEDQLSPAITRKMLRRETLKDPTLQQLTKDIGRGECRPALHQFT